MRSGVRSDVSSEFNIEIELTFKRNTKQTKHKIWMKDCYL